VEHFKYKYDDLFNPVLRALNKLGGSERMRMAERDRDPVNRDG
jgi:hypothetical protein